MMRYSAMTGCIPLWCSVIENQRSPYSRLQNVMLLSTSYRGVRSEGMPLQKAVGSTPVFKSSSSEDIRISLTVLSGDAVIYVAQGVSVGEILPNPADAKSYVLIFPPATRQNSIIRFSCPEISCCRKMRALP
jgi:hypothetical protein